jgi:hypothetical protein
MNREQDNAFPKGRRSASADAALRAEMRRVGKMTMEQRMNEALSLGKGLNALKTWAKERLSPRL